MVIKSMNRKTASFSQLIDYVNRPEVQKFEPLFHNLKTGKSDEVKEIKKEFQENALYCKARANGVMLYHEILSLSGKDQVDPHILQELGFRYLRQRAAGALAYGVIHLDQGNPHIHFVISGNLIESAKKLRLSKTQFDRIKKEIEGYQRKHYPDLKHSLVFNDTQAKSRPTQSEKERERRLREIGRSEPSRKEIVKRDFLACLTALNSSEFLQKLKQHNLSLYIRGETIGIEDEKTGRKYRLKTLGLFEKYQEALRQWEKATERIPEIEAITTEKIRRNWKEFEFKEQIIEILNRKDLSNDDPPPYQKRTEEIREIKKIQRRRRRERGLEL